MSWQPLIAGFRNTIGQQRCCFCYVHVGATFLCNMSCRVPAAFRSYARARWRVLNNFKLVFHSPCQSSLILAILVPFWVIITSSDFFYLRKLFFDLNLFWTLQKSKFKIYTDIASLKLFSFELSFQILFLCCEVRSRPSRSTLKRMEPHFKEWLITSLNGGLCPY